MKKYFIAAAIVFLLICQSVWFIAADAAAADRQPAVQQQSVQKTGTSLPVGKNPDVQAIKPKKPVSIRLHRNTGGKYSWDITGNSADDVYRADSRLRKLLQTDE
jgi:hypothetical protein